MQVLYLKREFEALKMNDAEKINDFITEVLKVVTQSDCWENNFLTAEL
jgi:hypothetical protein